MEYTYKTNGTCSRLITFELNGDKLHNVKFYGGCDGNLQAVSKLAEGLTVSELESRCKGIKCGAKSTSCPDQLAIGVRKAFDSQNKNID